ncbi:MAG: hypothetical protein FWE18_00250 [Alphaproteobacteria bacterium]|nr:hypothetical protein [Alphaproteobacteria bacterium]
MLENITQFQFNTHKARVVLLEDEPYFVFKDIASILGIKDTKQLIQRLNVRGYKHHLIADRLGRLQNTIILNESGLYDCIFESNKKEAKNFRFWITSEVLPSIRKTGKYSINNQAAEINQEYIEITEGVKYPMEWVWHNAMISYNYSEEVMESLNEMEKTIKTMKDRLKEINTLSLKMKEAAKDKRIDTKLVRFNKGNILGI